MKKMNDDMLDNELRQMWQTCQIETKNEPKRKRNHLIRLLDFCLTYFDGFMIDDHWRQSSISNNKQRTTNYCIGNWLIHQFIIDLSNHNHSSNDHNRLFDKYFLEDDQSVGLKFLQCFLLFSVNDGGHCIYNLELAKILTLVLNHFLSVKHSDNLGNQFDDQPLEFDWNSIKIETNFRENIYLKTFKHNTNEIVSPIKIKSWFKNISALHTRRKNWHIKSGHNNQSLKQPNAFIDYDSSSSAEESLECLPEFFKDSSIDRNVIKRFSMAEIDNEKTNKNYLIQIIEQLLMIMVQFEKNGCRTHFSLLKRCSKGQISMHIISELSYFFQEKIEQNSISQQIIGLNHLLLTSLSVICKYQPSIAIDILNKMGLIDTWMKFINNKSEFFHEESIETANCLLNLITTISQSFTFDTKNNDPQQTNVVLSFIIKMLCMDTKNQYKNIATFLMDCSWQNSNDKRLLRMIDLLKQLHIAIQCNHALAVHRRICRRKRRHIRCNLIPLMVHHHFHVQTQSTRVNNECPFGLSYSLLVKVMLTLAKQRDESILFDYVSQQLGQLVSCCCALRKYCKHLLLMAITSTTEPLSSSIRNSIFNVIELNIKIERHPIGDQNVQTFDEECNFCASNWINDPQSSPQQSSPLNSEGYATDNAYCCDHLNDSIDRKCSLESNNCLMSSLSDHYQALLKSESVSIRQSVYRHLYNLFSLVDGHCQQSIVSHIILPIIITDDEQYPFDVNLFVLRMLIAAAVLPLPINKRQKSMHQIQTGQQLLRMMVKLKAWPAIIRFIRYSNDDSNDNLAYLAINLLKNLLLCELIDNKLDQSNYQTIPIIIDNFLQHFDDCVHHKTIKHSFNKQSRLSFSEFIEFCRHQSFGIYIDDDQSAINHRIVHLTQIFTSLDRFSWLLNSTIESYPQLGQILNSEPYDRFTTKLWFHSRQLIEQIFVELKLFAALEQQHQSNEMHWKFCQRLLRSMELFATLLQRLERQDVTLVELITNQLETLIDTNPVAKSPTMISMIGQLLQMIIRISFECKISVNRLNVSSNNNFTDLFAIFDRQQQHRTSSFDSVLNEADETDLDSEYGKDCFILNSKKLSDDGYDGDIECMAKLQTIDNQSNLVNKQSSLLHNIDLCQTVLRILSEWLSRNSSVSKYVAVCLNQIYGYCKANRDNIAIMAEANFSQILMEYFRFILCSPNENECRAVKKLIFDLFIALNRNRLTNESIDLCIELLLTNGSHNDHESIVNVLNRILFPNNQINQFLIGPPKQCLRFPTTKLIGSNNRSSMKTETDWIDEIMNDDQFVGDNDDNNAFKSFAMAIPLNNSNIKHEVPFRCTLTYWIYLEKCASLIDKSNTDHNNNNHKQQLTYELLHICTFVLDCCVNVEIWFDFLYNRFVYRLSRKSNGKIFCLNESFIASHPDSLGSWTLICVDLDEKCDKRAHFIQINHVVNGQREKILKWSYPATLFNHAHRINESISSNCALLVGSVQSKMVNSHYKLSNLMLFKQPITSFARIVLFSLGPDFIHFHHLNQDIIQREQYFALPRQLANDNNVDMLTVCMSISDYMTNASQSILDNLVLLYRASKPTLYYSWMNQSESNRSMNPFFRTLLSRTNQSIIINNQQTNHRSFNQNESNIHQIRFNGTLNNNLTNSDGNNPMKILADCGGVSVLLFIHLYLIEHSDNLHLWNQTLELILNACNSHYYNRLMFDCHYEAYSLISHAYERTDKMVTTSLLKTYALFTLNWQNNNPVIIVPSNINLFIDSWRVWIRNSATSKLFFHILMSLSLPSNPFQSYNLAMLERTNAFNKLLHMIQDIHINFNDSSIIFDSSDQLIRLVQCLIENSCHKQSHLLKSVFECLLLLQNTEWLHVNQTKASFYYVFPSTWLTSKDTSSNDDDINMIELKNLSKKPVQRQWSLSQFDSTTTTNVDDDNSSNQLDDDEWEIVSELIDNHHQSPNSNNVYDAQRQGLFTDQDSVSNQSITRELIRLLDKYIDQIAIGPENISLLDFMIVLINNPSAQVRQQALDTFFKIFNQSFSNEQSEEERCKLKTLSLLMISNQIYNYYADESIMNSCVAFLFSITNKRRVEEICNHPETIMELERMVAKVALENYIPLLALLPKCLQPISLCYRILHLMQQIIEKMSINQLNTLNKQYGLPQSLSKLIINVNTQLSIPSEDMNKYNDEHLNEAIIRIIGKISVKYNHCNDKHIYSDFIEELFNYFAMIERKVTAHVATVFRHVQVTIFQSCFDELSKMTAASNNNKHSPINPKMIVERMRIVAQKSVDMIVCRNARIGVGQKEKYFQRELLYHLLDIISQIKLEKSSTKINKHLSNNRDLFKSLLIQLLTFLLSHLQSIDDRIFCLHLFFEKTIHFDQIKQFIGSNNQEPFIYLMKEFLNDLTEFGVQELNIFNWSAFVNNSNDDHNESFVSANRENHIKDSGCNHHEHPSALLLSYVCRKFSRQFESINRSSGDDQHFKKSILNDWHERIHEAQNEYETKLLRSSSSIFVNMSNVFETVLKQASQLNDRIILAQQNEKKKYIKRLKAQQSNNEFKQKRIIQLIGQLLHEKSKCFMPDYYPQSWELSPFESQGRVRTKMERCFLEMDDRYVLAEDDHHRKRRLRSKQLFATFMDDPIRLSMDNSSMTGQSIVSSCSEDEALQFTSMAHVILYDDQIEGEILVKRNRIKFVGNHNQSSNGNQQRSLNNFSSKRAYFQNFSIDLDQIQELIKCRYELQNKAIEIVLISGLTYLIAFESNMARDECYQHLMQNRDLLTNLSEPISLVSFTQMWRERRLSNFDYLMQLNRLSGRTFNDLMQYPVFPFVLSDYSSDILNLIDHQSYRDLSKPIAVQKKEREKYYIDQFNYIKAECSLIEQQNQNDPDSMPLPGVTSAPYHYGAHYSNSGIVLYYLVRLPPYTQMFLHYQDGNFDLPDRSFHSIQTTWRLATEDSTNGFKEMIPEFFYLPEFLLNNEHFDLGIRQNGERVNHVRLPPWCRGSARLFTLINRQALESNHVTRHLNHWFDLIFGYKQNGRAAIEAINVFHPATHFTADLSKIEDQVKRHALKTMIKTYGQMPTQLFQLPHPTVHSDAVSLPVEDYPQTSSAMGEVIGLKWGSYVGSPIFQKPVICFHKRFAYRIHRLEALPTNDLLLLPPNSSPLVSYNQSRNQFINTSYIIFYALCSWSPHHSNIWLRNQQHKRLFDAENSFLDEICICQSIPDYDWILVGYRSGIIIAFPLKFDKQFDIQRIRLKDRPSFFIGHRSLITSITINRNFNVALSTDSNGLCIVWDMNKQQYLRTILEADPQVSAVMTCISDTLGDLAVVTYCGSDQSRTSQLHVFTLNGQPIADIRTNQSEPYITAICYSSCPEGISINAIVTGFSDGSIKLWSSWDLTLIRNIHPDFNISTNSPIISICYSYKCDFLYLLNRNNCLIVLKNGESAVIQSMSLPTSSFTSNSSSTLTSDNFRILNLSNLNWPTID